MALLTPKSIQKLTCGPKIRKTCQMWQFRFLLCGDCEGMFLITFPPLPPPTTPQALPLPKVFGNWQKRRINGARLCPLYKEWEVDGARLCPPSWIVWSQPMSGWPSEYSSPLGTSAIASPNRLVHSLFSKEWQGGVAYLAVTGIRQGGINQLDWTKVRKVLGKH